MPGYIEREALIEDIDAAVKNSGMGCVVGQTLKRYVKRQTAADVAPVRHGRWYFESTYGYKTTRCSRCFWAHEGHLYFPFCPYCGARMERRVENVHCIGHSENAENAGR